MGTVTDTDMVVIMVTVMVMDMAIEPIYPRYDLDANVPS